MHVARTDVVQISYELTGPADRAPVIMIHGWPDAARGWRPVATRFRQNPVGHLEPTRLVLRR